MDPSIISYIYYSKTAEKWLISDSLGDPNKASIGISSKQLCLEDTFNGSDGIWHVFTGNVIIL